LVTISVGSMVLQGFNMGVEFKGGATFQWPSKGASVSEARELFEDEGIEDPIVQTVGRGAGQDLRVQTPPLSETRIDEVIAGISEHFPEVKPDEVNPSNVGPAWGDQVTKKAIQGLIAFLVLVMIYISIRFEPKMAFASIVGLLHDLILAAGIYSLTQFVVTPSTIIALLTILGFSLYDAVVVFDKVEENTRGIAGRSSETYTEAAELALNQTFMRSVNTTLIAMLPVSGLLFVGAGLLGAGTLKDLSLALFVGMGAGAYSSIFLCTPLFVGLKEREPQYKALTQRVLARRAGGGVRGATGTRFAQRAAARAAAETPAAAAETAPAAAGAPAATGKSTPAAKRRPQQKKRKGGKSGRPSGRRRR
ncbi:MAG TPA: protein translocase subunit SecF, partial [Mycobacteriales bacterium]|nr:protein translocase subunit SecF [Mycobacteriales bacterium]